MQIENLKNDGAGFDWYFVAYGHPADVDVEPMKKHVHGVLMTAGAWDVSFQTSSRAEHLILR